MKNLLLLTGIFALAGLGFWGCSPPSSKTALLNASHLVLVSADQDETPLRTTAVRFFQDEVFARTQLKIPSRSDSNGTNGPYLILSTHPKNLPHFPRTDWQTEWDTLNSEGFCIRSGENNPGPFQIVLLARSNRGILFGLGWLLRKMVWAHGKLLFPARLSVTTSPQTTFRGDQLGYRPLSNTYDAWDLTRYEQYIRDLAVFGANSIELVISPKTDPKKQILMKTPPDKMNPALSKLIHRYGMQVWVWSAVTDINPNDPGSIRRALKRRERWFRALPYIDHWFVPGGDPGDLPVPLLFDFLQKMATLLHTFHPNAKVWMSNQGFDAQKNRLFFDYLNRVHPHWLGGVVYGPWTHLSLTEERARVPSFYSLRRYPDIGHSVRCQYPVPHWDRAFAIIENREPINPRPTQMAHIFLQFQHSADGFVAYSEGINDDVNKAVWNALGWNPNASVTTILADYVRYFISPQLVKPLVQGFLGLEKNWQGPVLENVHIRRTLKLWEKIAGENPSLEKSNWRFQSGLFRAFLDALVQHRALLEKRQEEHMNAVLRKLAAQTPAAAIDSALAIIRQHPSDRETRELTSRVLKIGEELHRTIGIQLSVPLQHAYGSERGAVLDALGASLNNREWLLGMLAGIGVLPDVKDQRTGIEQILNWENPGPGGFYDDLGNATKEPHLLLGKGWAQDPGFVASAQDEFSGDPPQRLSWRDQAQTLYATPLKMRYTSLDPKAHYTLRVLYAGRFHPTMTLTANDSILIHGPLPQPRDFIPRRFDIPQAATRTGTLTLTWHRVSGRGCQVAEVWLEKK